MGAKKVRRQTHHQEVGVSASSIDYVDAFTDFFPFSTYPSNHLGYLYHVEGSSPGAVQIHNFKCFKAGILPHHNDEK